MCLMAAKSTSVYGFGVGNPKSGPHVEVVFSNNPRVVIVQKLPTS